ncbi:MAG TPA: hypothetical protein VK675_01590 [Candidatus Paceibacterota bacterium]|nr:hypothetical protein [Candidatus Paceibacterota bacterium]
MNKDALKTYLIVTIAIIAGFFFAYNKFYRSDSLPNSKLPTKIANAPGIPMEDLI